MSQSLDDYRKAQVAEWGQYVATQPIFVGGARAFNVGDPVPAAHVNNGVVNENQVKAVKPATEKKGN